MLLRPAAGYDPAPFDAGRLDRVDPGEFPDSVDRGGHQHTAVQAGTREVKILMRLPNGRNVATRQAVHGSAPCARTEVLALFAVGDVYVSLCKKALTLHLARAEGRERLFWL